MIKRLFVFLSFCLFAAVSAVAFPVEVIEEFRSSARIREDASAQITETIVVRSAGRQIKRGIFRVLPYKGVSAYEIVSVLRDGKKEPFHEVLTSSDKTVYIGDSETLLPPGRYEYQISYIVKDVVRFQKKFDEFYWNVTGNEWQFPIQKVSFRLVLPPGADIVPGGISYYTGLSGAKGQDAAFVEQDFSFFTTRPLNRGEGLTISAAWNKGVVKEPLLLKMLPVLAIVGKCLLFVAWVWLLVYYVRTWRRVGKDPTARVIRRFEPPEGLSPAQARYLRQKKNLDGKILSVVMMSLMQKGAMGVEKSGKRDFRLIKTSLSAGEILSAEEQACWMALFSGSDELPVTSEYASVFQSADAAVGRALREWGGRRFFAYNSAYNTPTYFFLLFALAVGMIPTLRMWKEFFPFPLFFAFLAFVTFCLMLSMIRGCLMHIVGRFILFIVLMLCFRGLLTSVAGAFGIFILLALLPGLLFYYLIPAYTPQGRKYLDEIEGFLEYLTVAETNRVFASNPTDATRIYCNYLPYAVALDVENEWWNAFAKELGEAAAAAAVASSKAMSVSDFGSFAGSIRSAQHAPSSSGSDSDSNFDSDSSSSGFGGGGCSGGGSGGGGGGGW